MIFQCDWNVKYFYRNRRTRETFFEWIIHVHMQAQQHRIAVALRFEFVFHIFFFRVGMKTKARQSQRRTEYFIHDSSVYRSSNNFDNDDRWISCKLSVRPEGNSVLWSHCSSRLNGKRISGGNSNFPFNVMAVPMTTKSIEMVKSRAKSFANVSLTSRKAWGKTYVCVRFAGTNQMARI